MITHKNAKRLISIITAIMFTLPIHPANPTPKAAKDKPSLVETLKKQLDSMNTQNEDTENYLKDINTTEEANVSLTKKISKKITSINTKIELLKAGFKKQLDDVKSKLSTQSKEQINEKIKKLTDEHKKKITSLKTIESQLTEQIEEKEAALKEQKAQAQEAEDKKKKSLDDFMKIKEDLQTKTNGLTNQVKKLNDKVKTNDTALKEQKTQAQAAQNKLETKLSALDQPVADLEAAVAVVEEKLKPTPAG